ncbi:MAG: sulfite exporter TauE/SafE family protein [Chloroflexi bacterium]|nr:MAG: sulfite exporter TauE/SafE family protein [Chloroflexota bacterium]TMG65145.1 MAG: sulfite exporter TauE/SafE family protein [Chloroflexota bacterium]
MGFLGGLLGGLLGVGGGFVLVPLQALWAGVPQRFANANSLVAIIPIAVAALPIYYFRKGSPQVDLHAALFLIIGSVVGAYVGARVLRRIPDRELKIGVALILGVVGLKELVIP